MAKLDFAISLSFCYFIMFKIRITHQEGLIGSVLGAGFLNLLIGAIALILDIILEIPPLPISKVVAFFIFLALMAVYAIWLIWSSLVLISAKKKNRLAKTGPYSLTRHPMYFGIVLLVNPALAILLGSWSLIEACLIFYFVWKYFARKEEKQLIETFGSEYKEYSEKVGCFFPKIC